MIITSKDIKLTEKNICSPTNLKWESFTYGGGVQKYFKFKLTEQKTQNLHNIEFLKLTVPKSILANLHNTISQNCDCLTSELHPYISGSWDWHLQFICSKCGQKYLCQCFKKAFEKQIEIDNNWKLSQPKDHIKSYEKNGWPTAMSLEWAKDAQYREAICHLCTNTPSNLTYCSSMYGSSIKVKYGPYIMRTSIEKDISEREAENEIREEIGFPKIGEGWVGETELYKTVCHILGDQYEVIREASPKWLGRQRLDIYIPSLSLAIEYHGQQHFQPVEYFGGEKAFQKNIQRDKLKEALCRENGIHLLIIKHSDKQSEQTIKRKILQKLNRDHL
ncbi:DUF2726 domain-containing protein [Halobacteriovorax sp. GB3]|uniref:DUF2726 domain-containing protein n=1 Tax=Halobacteriovorax sp. GB3 TaxID=2719615 RepID=UPI00235FFBB6|nr:DUF2726 domain-containing protein [Halobacteriovorax sp. GB3]MDD0853982.1 DUF2726 domain-containing protein [Halobacteriovorax sp. GB3]